MMMAAMWNIEYSQSEIAIQKPWYADSSILTIETTKLIKIPI